jgi:hypothetical protein
MKTIRTLSAELELRTLGILVDSPVDENIGRSASFSRELELGSASVVSEVDIVGKLRESVSLKQPERFYEAVMMDGSAPRFPLHPNPRNITACSMLSSHTKTNAYETE